MNPNEYGLPDKFSSWRPNQERAIESIVGGEKRFTAVVAPTGFGKSPTKIAAALGLGKRAFLVTSTKGLQDQDLEDFGDIGLADIRGKGAYPCAMRSDYTCEDGSLGKCNFKGSVLCPSTQAELGASHADLVSTNYSKWIASKKFGVGMGNVEALFLDEAHSAVDELCNALQVQLHHKEVEELLNLRFLIGDKAHSMIHWKGWCAAARMRTERLYKAVSEKIAANHNPKLTWVREASHLKNLHRNLSLLQGASAKEWVVEENNKGFIFDAITPAMYSEPFLFMWVPRVILLSATLRPKTMAMLGVARDKYDFLEFPSEFSPESGPVYVVPTMSMEYDPNPDFSILNMRIDQIIRGRLDRKGIIHCHSYKLRDAIYEGSKCSHYMLKNTQGENITETIAKFKAAPAPCTLLSPAVTTGYDFPLDKSEYQIIPQIPFPVMVSKVMKERMKRDRTYSSYKAMTTLTQALGRSQRSVDDRCETFILDDRFKGFYGRFKYFCPDWVHPKIKFVNSVPRPLDKL